MPIAAMTQGARSVSLLSRAAVAAGALLLAGLGGGAAGCAAPTAPAESSAGNGASPPGSSPLAAPPPPSAPCHDGDTVSCHISAVKQAGVETCFAGVSTCEGGVFSACAPAPPPSDPSPTTFVATCAAPLVARWSRLEWSAKLPAGARVQIFAQALPDPASAAAHAPAAPTLVVDATAGGDPAACTSLGCAKDLGAALGDGRALPRLRVSTRVQGDHGAGATPPTPPTLDEVLALFDCVSP